MPGFAPSRIESPSQTVVAVNGVITAATAVGTIVIETVVARLQAFTVQLYVPGAVMICVNALPLSGGFQDTALVVDAVSEIIIVSPGHITPEGEASIDGVLYC